jgi:Phytanoyl-CoA dioxygenase (PhyH)
MNRRQPIESSTPDRVAPCEAGERTAALVRDGWTMLPAWLPRDLVDRLARDLDGACADQRPLQLRNGVGDGTDGTVHHLPCAGGSFLELLEGDHGQHLLESYFRGPFILNTYGGLLNLPGDPTYVARVHRDQRTFSGDCRLMAQLLVMLDEFTPDNGATFLLTGSHRQPEQPSDDVFFRDAARAIGPAGSIVMFDSNLWHAAGPNRSERPRRALTLAFTRPFIKQQLDYPRALGYDRAESFSASVRQLLGYNARVPASLDEWYQPPERRLYKRDQG